MAPSAAPVGQAFPPGPAQPQATSRPALPRILTCFHLPFSGTLGLLLVIAFFLPWLRIGCAAMIVSEPTGYDLTFNKQDATMEDFGSMGSMGEGDMTFSSDMDPDDPWGGPSYELLFIPVMGIILLVAGLVRLARPGTGERRFAVGVLLLGLLGLVFLLIEENKAFRKDELQEFKDMSEGKATEAPRSTGASESTGMDQQMDEAFNEMGQQMGQQMTKYEWGTGLVLSVLALAGLMAVNLIWLLTPWSKEVG